jgi:predicted dienelactone hydrolase
MRFWQPPQDVSFTIDSLSEEGLFNIPLKTEKVIMLGHSSREFTSIAIAGANLEAGKLEAYCASVELTIKKLTMLPIIILRNNNALKHFYLLVKNNACTSYCKPLYIDFYIF